MIKILFCETPPMKEIKKSRNDEQNNFMNVQNNLLVRPFLLKECGFFSPNTEISVEK